MKANEFIQKYGWGAAYDLWQAAFPLFENNLCILSGSVCNLSESKPLFSLLDLKRLVESHELVEWHGGLKYAKSYFERNSKEYPDVNGWDELVAAIADVESCL